MIVFVVILSARAKGEERDKRQSTVVLWQYMLIFVTKYLNFLLARDHIIHTSVSSFLQFLAIV